jgi:hypothetical protein
MSARRLPLLMPLAALIIAAGCDDERPAALPTAPAGVDANKLSAFLAVSKPLAGVGDRITVTVRALRGASVGEIGSYTLRVDYDTTRLQLVETARSDFGMVMANGETRGVIRAAGASGQGFQDDRLLTATFLVRAPNPTRGLSLHVTELNSIAFEDQKSALRVEKSVYLSEQQ